MWLQLPEEDNPPQNLAARSGHLRVSDFTSVFDPKRTFPSELIRAQTRPVKPDHTGLGFDSALTAT